MHRSLKPHAQAKKVPPPAIPGDPILSPQSNHYYQQIPLYRLGNSITNSSSAGKQLDDGIAMSSLVSSPSLEEGGFNLPREPTVALRLKDEISEYNAGTMSSSSGPVTQTQTTGSIPKTTPQNNLATNPLLSGCPPVIVPCPPPVYCATLREPLTHKAAVYYHQQLALQEDQGIDLTQSPGRDSPGSSSGSAGSGSRHSTASLDSGRASSYLTGASIRSSTGGSAGCAGGPLSSPRCSSLSSCSISSVDRQRNDELIIDWLMEMKYEEYAQLFIAAGYDLPTIARMTPEDLTAIGIKNPHHRERIKQRIDKLQVLDNLPHFVPGSIEEWLQLLRLEEYIQPLLDQNYKTVRDVTQVTWEDLEDIGIVKLGHQKKIILAIKRVKDIISGKWNPGGSTYQQEYRKAISQLPTYIPTARVSWDDSRIYSLGVTESLLSPPMQPLHQPTTPTPTTPTSPTTTTYYCTGSNHESCNGNDLVLIKVRQPRGKSLESLEDIHDNSTRSHLTFSHYTTTDYGHFAHPAQMQQHQQVLQQQHHLLQQQQAALMGPNSNRLLTNASAAMAWRRSYDDGDITPTNDAAIAAASRDLLYEEGGGTLPRQQQRGILQRAVLNSMPPIIDHHSPHHHHYMNAAAAAEYVCHGGVTGMGMPITPGTVQGGLAGISGILDQSSSNQSYITGSPMASKKIAPEPPRRHCSIRNSRALSTDGSQQQQQQQLGQQGSATGANLYYGPGSAGAIIHHTSGSVYLQQPQSTQPIYANYATIQQTTAEIHCEKFHDNKSNSSIDSIDTIPFANENTGTIKQRLLNRQEISGNGCASAGSVTSHLHSSSSSSSSSSTNTIANITHSFHSLKTSASLHDGSLIRSDSIGSNTSGGSAGAATGVAYLRSPTLQYPGAMMDGSSGGTTITTTVEMHTPCNATNVIDNNAATAAAAVGTTSNAGDNATNNDAAAAAATTTNPQQQQQQPLQGKVSVNVLNDIGNMLANLTDELDAMLEEEKRVGLNIDSE